MRKIVIRVDVVKIWSRLVIHLEQQGAANLHTCVLVFGSSYTIHKRWSGRRDQHQLLVLLCVSLAIGDRDGGGNHARRVEHPAGAFYRSGSDHAGVSGNDGLASFRSRWYIFPGFAAPM